MENGKNAWRGVLHLKHRIKLVEAALSGGALEREGPLGSTLDVYCDSDDLGTGTFEKAEAEMVRMTVNTLLAKAGITEKQVDLMIAGDLMNQCTSSAYGLSEFDIPYLGLYGACSTFAAGLLTAALLIDAGQIDTVIVVASSHFCTAERQFRYPLEYGALSGTTAQTTVTGGGAVLLARAKPEEACVALTRGMYGIVSDRGIRDTGNMGAAMASAAADTILRYLSDTGESATSYDTIMTGDLGKEGLSLTREMLAEKGVTPGAILCDGGMTIYDLEKQKVGCGGSGCGCSAVVTAGHLFPALKKGAMRRVLLTGTGALMSPQSIQQGLSIPGIGHLVCFERV